MNHGVAFLVQNNYVTYNTIPVALYAHAEGHQVVDVSSHRDFDVMACEIDWTKFDAVFAYGSVQFMRLLKQSPIGHHIHHSEQAFSTTNWVGRFGDLALNYDGKLAKVSEVASILDARQSAHVRPDAEDKAFTAAAFTPETWAQCRKDRPIRDDLDVVVSSIKAIEAEYRCWVIGSKVIEISQYRKDHSHCIATVNDPEVWEEARKLASVHLPNETIVMDIAKTGAGFKLIEFNPIHAAGWYAADVKKVLDTYVNWRMSQQSRSLTA